ncbi:MAG: hypothetical protein ACLFV3_10165 [Phycisphaeraceae bacterium]
MRLIVDTLMVVMLAGVLVAVVMHHQQAKEDLRRQADAQRALEALQEQAMYRAAVGETQLSDGGHPRRIDANWFGEQIPRNPLSVRNQPWLDIAEPGDWSLHPKDPVLSSSDQAGFWYNPTTGVFRARVPRQASERETLRLYNLVNGSAMTELPMQEMPAEGEPDAPIMADQESDQPEAGQDRDAPRKRSRPALPQLEPDRPTLESLAVSAE